MLKFLFFNQFQNNHLSRITHARTKFQHAGVSAIASGKAGGNFVEETFDELVISKFRDDQSTRVHLLDFTALCTVASDGNKTFGLTTDRRCLRARGLNSLVCIKLFD